MIGKKFGDKLRESMTAVLPIIALVLLLSLSVAPMPAGTLLTFLFGGLLLIVGMMLFSLGAEVSMEPMGSYVGSGITKTKNLKLILILGFFLGVMITMSEPDLQVLANQIQSIPNMVLIISVAVGVGLFLVAALLRMLFRIPLRRLLWIFYGVVFLLAVFAPESFMAVAFDSGGVTTGPMTVPFIMAFGIGITSIRSDEGAAEDSFGLISLCSVGPIIAVLVLSMIFRADGAEYARTAIPNVSMSVELTDLFAVELPNYLKEIGIALLPIVVFFFVFEAICVKLNFSMLSRIGLGLIYTYAGLTLFLTGANVGFMPAGAYLGSELAKTAFSWIVIPIGMLIGFFIVKAEPAVYVLMRQVEELTDGDISGKSLQTSLCIGVSVSVGLAMLRVLTGISILWMMVPGYALALAMTFFTPRIFTAIAFDSGGVASGPMTATFLLPFACGACIALDGNVVTDAFGVVAMVAMTPLITIQILGIVYNIRSKVRKKSAGITTGDLFADMPDNMIIDL